MNNNNKSKCDLYFAYGSNLNPTQMGSRCPGATAFGIGVMADWDFRIGHRGVATITPRLGGHVWGGLWKVTPDHLEALDEFEGVGSGLYEREIVEVRVEDKYVEAVAYIEPFAFDGEPRIGYLDRILTGAQWFELPGSYINTLKEVGV